MVQSHLALVHQPVGQMQEIALGDADAEGIMSVDALLTAVGIEPLVGGHAVGETAQQPPPLIVDGGDVGIDDGANAFFKKTSAINKSSGVVTLIFSYFP